jgi:hypothetical protein
MKFFKNIKHKFLRKSSKDIIDTFKEIKTLYDNDEVEEIEDIVQKQIIKQHGKDAKVVHDNTLYTVLYHYNLDTNSFDRSKYNKTELNNIDKEYIQLAEAEECYRLRHKDVYPRAGIVYRWSNKAQDLVPHNGKPPKSCKTRKNKNKLRNKTRNKH